MRENYSSAPVTIRPMELRDIPRVREIDLASFSLPWPERSFRFEITENPASRLWVAETQSPDGQNVVVGMIVMWQVLDEAHIGTFAIHPAYRQQGIGRRLLAESLLEVYEMGVRQCYLEVRRSNLAAQNLYKKFGFKITAVRSGYYRDNGEDALIMTLENIQPQKLRAFLQDSGKEVGTIPSGEIDHGSA
ncbi:MAG: ribosomal protein S18-alanine N-acetyltransferase [Bellilinea sp.]